MGSQATGQNKIAQSQVKLLKQRQGIIAVQMNRSQPLQGPFRSLLRQSGTLTLKKVDLFKGPIPTYHKSRQMPFRFGEGLWKN